MLSIKLTHYCVSTTTEHLNIHIYSLDNDEGKDEDKDDHYH